MMALIPSIFWRRSSIFNPFSLNVWESGTPSSTFYRPQPLSLFPPGQICSHHNRPRRRQHWPERTSNANTFIADGPGARGRQRWRWRMKKLEMEDYRLKKRMKLGSRQQPVMWYYNGNCEHDIEGEWQIWSKKKRMVFLTKNEKWTAI